jgi:DNA-binding PadR family transcriptional regulator
LFDYGELRLLLLAMIAERPHHGYELIKAVEERVGGSYSPSSGVIYPTLSWLDDMGYAQVHAEETDRKRYRITAEGEAFLVANRAAADELLARAGPGGAGGLDPVPASVVPRWRTSSSPCVCACDAAPLIKPPLTPSPQRSMQWRKLWSIADV